MQKPLGSMINQSNECTDKETQLKIKGDHTKAKENPCQQQEHQRTTHWNPRKSEDQRNIPETPCKLAVRPRLSRKGVLGVYVNSKQHTRGELPVCAVPTIAGKLNISWETAGKAPGNGRETTQPPLPHQGRQDHRANGAMAHRTCDTLNSK